MNWDQFEGKWKQMKGSVREEWGKLTDDDVDNISGKKEQLVGRLQERYGIAKEAAEKQASGNSRLSQLRHLWLVGGGTSSLVGPAFLASRNSSGLLQKIQQGGINLIGMSPSNAVRSAFNCYQ